MAAAKKAKPKNEFTRCPHCTKRFGSEHTLAAHVTDHRIQHIKASVHPDHLAVLHPLAHHEELKSILKRGGHG
jgi:hypothetical protein